MTAARYDSVISTASAALADWNFAANEMFGLEAPDGSRLDGSLPIPGISPQSTVDDLGKKLSGTVALIFTLSDVESELLIPDVVTNDLLARVGSVRATVEKLLVQINSLDDDGEITSVSADTLSATNAKGQALNLAPILAELYPLVQALLSSVHQVRAVAEISGKGGLALELTEINLARSAQRKALGDLKRLSRLVQGQQKTLESLSATAKETADNIAKAEVSAKADIARVTDSKVQAEQLIASATASEQAAAKLKESVEAYSKAFATFQKDLDARNVAFEKGKEALQLFLTDSQNKRDALLKSQTETHKALSEAIRTQEQEIERLLGRSREVLGEATVSGLSDSFATEMLGAGRELQRMQVLFFASIALLIFGVGIAFEAVPWLSGKIQIAKLQQPAGNDPWTFAVYLLANFLRTMTLLLGPLLLLIYAARRYTELFRMRAAYTYKYTVAASLPGFKLEAPTFAEAITAAAFKELLFNPGETVINPEEKSKEKGNTFLQRLLEPAILKAMDKMGGAPKG